MGSRIGSPAAMDERTMAPTKSLMASGRSLFLMKIALAEAAGQVCQPMSPAPTILAGSEIGLGDQHVDRRERRRWRRYLGRLGLSKAARQHGGSAAGSEGDTEYDQTRGFHYASRSKVTTTAGTAVNSGFHQLNVKAWLMRSIQIALIARYAALCGDRIQRLSPTIEPARGLGSRLEYFRRPAFAWIKSGPAFGSGAKCRRPPSTRSVDRREAPPPRAPHRRERHRRGGATAQPTPGRRTRSGAA